uniref:WD40/YVTN/BNR-like repeat-containing protein n=1 Tax=Emticicia sp. TaxID=1930953 RepID=UPI003BA6B7C7
VGDYDIQPYIEGERKWELKENDVLDNTLFAAAMADKNTGIAVGKYGSMVITRDGGKTWEQRSFTDFYFSDIQFVDENNGFLLGNKNSRPYILKTIDKGVTWQVIDVNFPYQGFEDLYFIDGQTGWIAGSGKSILKTTDGGFNWFVQAMDFGSGINFNSIFFANTQNGWAVGNNGYVYLTSDGGNNWFERRADTFRSLRAVYFVNQHKGFVVGEGGEVFSSVDGGNSWSEVTEITDKLTTLYTRIQFVDELNGFIFGGSIILYTNDGGITWGKRYTSIGGAHKMGAYLLDSQHGIISGGGGAVALTHNGTLSWIEKNVNVLDFKGVKFVDKFNGWAFSEKNYAKTIDGGKTWTYHSLNNNETIVRWFFLNKNIGWLITAGKSVFKTIDGGLSWTQMSFNVNLGNSFFSGIFFFDENNGWIVGTFNLALKTTDGGQTWTSVNNISYEQNSFQDIYFASRNKGWITQSQGVIYVTNDGGRTWQKQQLETTYDITKIFFINVDVGWICAKGDFFRTEDGGQTWYKSNFWINYLTSVHFSDTQNGWALIGGFLNYSTDGGRSWQEIKSLNISTDLSFLDENEILVVGWNKQILTYGIEKKYLCPSNVISIKNAPIPPIISSFSTVICSGKDLKISSNNCSGSIIWNNGSTGEQLHVTNAGTYSAKCVDYGCESISSNAIVIVEELNCQPIELIPSVVYACPNENIVLSVMGCPNNDVTWSNSMTGSSISIQVNASIVIDAYCRSGGNISVPVTVASRNLEITNDIQKGVHSIGAIETLITRKKILSIEGFDTQPKVSFWSGKSILLEPGFEVKQTARFTAQIKSCD